MTIRKGTAWGEPARLPADAAVVRSDTDLAAAWVQHRELHAEGPLVVGLAGGDLHRTLGSPPPQRMHTDEAWSFPMDLLRVTLDDGELWAAAHVVAGGDPIFRGWTVVAMNAAFLGDANLGPRAHPNDGLMDLTVGSLAPMERRRARARMGLGTHVPHPMLAVYRSKQWEIRRDAPTAVRVDGRAVGKSVLIRIEVIADALVVVA